MCYIGLARGRFAPPSNPLLSACGRGAPPPVSRGGAPMTDRRTAVVRACVLPSEHAARIGNNLNQIARWENTHAETAEAVEVIAHLVAIERAIARLDRFGDEWPDAR